MAYSYACADCEGMEACPGKVIAETEEEVWKLIELHAKIAHDENASEWDGEEPRAAIVLLHTCTGISKFEEIWSDKLVSWGCVVFSVDSFTLFTPINISIRREFYETYNIQASRNRQA